MKITNNEAQSNDDVKAYLKIKTVTTPSVIPYIKISNSGKTISLKKAENKNDYDKTVYTYDADKVFKENDEYSYIYEEVTLNCISESIRGRNFCFFSFGETSSEKHSLIFGGPDCSKNLNERGVFPRLIESFLSKQRSICYSLMCVNGKHLIDLTKYLNREIISLSIDDFIRGSLEIKQSPEIIYEMIQISIKNSNEITTLLSNFNKLYSHLYSIELESDIKLNSFSHFIYTLHLYDSDTNLVSTITLCELSGNDNRVTKVTNPHSSTKQGLINTKAIIDNTNTYECIKRSIKNLKCLKKKNDQIQEPFIENAKVLIVLQKLSFTSFNTKFIILGCIYPNVGMQETVRDTLSFLFECKKISLDKSMIEETNRDEENNNNDLIYNNEAKEKKLKIIIKEQAEIIRYKNNRIESIQELYQKQIQKLKSAFNFEGDVNLLLGGNDSTKEAKFAKRIREALINSSNQHSKNEELKNKQRELEQKVDKLKQKNEVIENDQTMLEYVTQIREDKLNEQEKLKLHLENSKELLSLKEINKKLMNLNKEYVKEIESKNAIIKNFTYILQDKKVKSKTIDEIKDCMKNEQVEKNKAEYNSLYSQYNRELYQLKEKYEGLIKQKENYISNLNNSYDQLVIKHNKKIKSMKNEMVILYSSLVNLINVYKEDFSFKLPSQISVTKYNQLLNSKENYMKLIDETCLDINPINYPITLKQVELNQKDTTKCRKTKKNTIENNSTSNHIGRSVSNSLILHNADDLLSELQKENNKLKKRIRELIDIYNSKISKCVCGNKEHLANSNEKVIKKLEEMINENTKNNILIGAHQRIINQLNMENMTMKSFMGKKLIKDRINYPLPSTFKKTNNNYSSLHKSKSTNDISSQSFIRPKTGFVSMNKSRVSPR